MPSAGFERDQGFFDSLHDWMALMGTNGFTQARSGRAFAQGAFDPVKVLNLAQDPTRRPRRLFQRLMELSSHVRPTSGQLDSPACLNEGAVG